MKAHNYYVYILTNWNDKVMYVGVTNNLARRLSEHKNKVNDGFTKRYNVNKLVYYEHGNDIRAAIAREKEIKKWRREKKNNLVASMNPTWKDLSSEWQVGRISPFGRNDERVEMTTGRNDEPVEMTNDRAGRNNERVEVTNNKTGRSDEQQDGSE